MPKQKYDWEGLKQEFFESDYMEVKSFLIAKWITYEKQNRTHTAGRTKAKREHKKQILDQSKEKQIEVKIDYAKRREQKVQEAIDWIIDDIIKRVKNTDNRKERVTYLEKLKEDIGEGKKMILDVTTNSTKTEEDQEILDKIKKDLWLSGEMFSE